MRVAVVGPTFPFRGGISHYTTLLCRAIRARHELLLVSFTRQYPRALFPGRTDRDESREPLRLEGTLYVIDSLKPWTWWQAAQAIRRFRPTKVVLQWWVVYWFPQLFVILRLLQRTEGLRVVIVCHNVVEHETNWLKKALTRVLLKRADVLVTHSETERRDLHSFLGESTATVAGFLPAFVVGREGHCDRAAARRELGLSGNVLLFFGFVREYKGLRVLLEAMPVVLKQRDVTLLVVGEFWRDKESYLDRIRAEGLESWVVVVDRYVRNEEAELYFCAADVIVQPYVSATGSAVTQLAYGLDRPVIATRVGNIPEVIVDGENGLLVDPGDVEGLARAILHSLEPEVLERLQRNAPAVKERFTWDRMAAIVLGDTGPKA